MSLSIDNYASQIGDLYSSTTGNSSSTSKLESTLSSDLSEATDEELMDVCKQFESYFVEQVIKAMEKMIPENEDEEDSSVSQTVDYFKDTVIQDIASQSTESQSLGLAQTLYESMKRQYDI
jgi:flagellar protein FlgJ